MLNIYLVIDSKVFGVTIDVNFLFAIVIERFNNCKHVVEEERMQLRSTSGKNCKLKYSSCKLIVKGERKQFHCTSSKNGFKCKRLRE